MVAACPQCQTTLNCEESMQGNVFKCPVCGSNLTLINGVLMPTGGMAPFAGQNDAAYDDFEPMDDKSVKTPSSGGSALAVVLSIIAIISTAVCSYLLFSRTEILKSTKYFDDVEEAAEYKFRRWVLSHRINGNQKSYMIRECESEVLDNFEVDIITKGDYVLALWRTKVNGRSYFGHDWFMQNKEGLYVGHYLSEYSEDLTADEKEWVKKMKERISDHEKSNSDFEWNVRVK